MKKVFYVIATFTPTGPQPTWDPDIVAGLDEDFDFGNPSNLLDDDFIVQANCLDG